MQRISVVEFKRYRYFKVMSALVVLGVAAYIWDEPATEPFGGTLLGYILGVLAALLVVVLLLYGIRKRVMPRIPKTLVNDGLLSALQRKESATTIRHQNEGRRGGFTLQGWLSAHIYLGASLVVLATLHTGFHFAWNLHTLSYLLMMFVIASGFYGIYAYLRFPSLMTENMGEDTLEGLLLKINDFDQLAASKSFQFPNEICELVARAQRDTRIGGNVLQQLSGRQKNCPTAFAVEQLQNMGKGFKGEQLKSFHDLYAIMAHKEAVVVRARKEVMFKARLELWLFFHAPLSVVFLVALLIHILAIFFYW